MRNIKTILMVMLLLTLALSVTIGLTSCGETEVHVHEFKTEVLIEATCTEAGDAKYTCTCGYSYTETVPALGHTVVADEAVAATCTESGLTAGAHCSACNLVLEKQTATSPLGHKLGAEATCTTAQVCENGCGKEFAPAIGHLVTSPATCTESADCVLCGEVVTAALGHDFDVKKGYAETCTADGLTDGKYCKRCTYTETAVVIPATGHATDVVVNVVDPTCEDGGYTNYTCLCGIKTSVGSYTDALGHNFDTALAEGANGFYNPCANNCGNTVPAAAPVADSYKASIQNGYASNRVNELILKAGQYGAWGVTLTGAKLSTEYDGGIGSFDEANRTVKYEFVLDQDGYVDIIWTIASSNWDSATETNIGIADMAAHMTITIDGKPVDISGLELPEGDGVNTEVWWNLQDFVIEGVALEAGLHSFECTVNVHGGLNVGYMSIKSNQGIHARSINVLNADIVTENGNVYYEVYANIYGYTVDQLEMSDGDIKYALHSYSVKDGITTLRYDITREYKLYPHIKADGKWYVNNKNNVGDVIASAVQEGKSLSVNGRTFTIGDKYGMPVPLVTMNEGTAASATPVSADLIEENGKVYWTFTYKLVGFYPEYLRIVDGSTVFNWESFTENADGTVTYKINVTDYATGSKYPHLQIMETLYTGAGHSSAGDILAESFPTKSIVIGTKEYKIYNAWSMPAIEIVSNEPTMKLTAYDLVEENGKAILKLTFTCYVFDERSAVFFGNDNAGLSYTCVRDGASVIYSIDITDKNASDNIYMHMSIEGQNWNPRDNVASSNGDLLATSGQTGSSWVTKKTLTVNGRNYVLGNQYNMIVIGK